MADEVAEVTEEGTETTEEATETTESAISSTEEGSSEATKTAEKQEVVGWRDRIADPELRKVAERFNSETDAVKAVVDLRKMVSTSIRLPTEKSTPEEIAEFHKKMGVPEAPEGYKFEMPEGQEATDVDKQFQSFFAKTFHDAHLSASQASALNTAWNEFNAAVAEATSKADAEFAAKSEEALKTEWGADYDRNKELAKRAASSVLGADFEDAAMIEMKDGRFLLDHPIIVKAFASIGSEMSEDKIGPRLNESERDTLNGQIDDLEREKMEAYDSGDRSKARRLDEEQRKLIEKLQSRGPIVGSEGRVA